MRASRVAVYRLLPAGLATLLALGALLVFNAGLALAASQPAIEEEAAFEVSSGAATLRATVNPGGADTTYYFQYGTASCSASPSACKDLPAAPGVGLGEGSEGLSVSLLATELAPSTTYHYRVVAINEIGESAGVEKTFTTQGTATTFELPDGRMWEMVTPLHKQGAAIDAIGNEQGADIQAAEDGSGITFGATAPFVESPAGSNTPEVTQVISRRTAPGSWETQDVSIAHEAPAQVGVGHAAEYKLFSTDLSLGAVEPQVHEGLEKTIYLRTASGELMPLVSPDNTRPGVDFSAAKNGLGVVKFMTATPDFRHVVIQASEQLTETPTGGGGGLYVWAAGKLELASVLPNGEGTVGYLGYNERDLRHAISNDGSRVVWEQHRIVYLRDMIREETVEVGSGQYVTASTSGSRIFFASEAQLTADSTAEKLHPDLYEFEVTSGEGEPLAGKLTDLTVDSNMGEAANLLGVIEVSEDGSYVYFVATGALAAGAEAGSPNLYVERLESEVWSAPKLIATLSAADGPTWKDSLGIFDGALQDLTARVSPNGRYLAFMSELSLTGYENRDANRGVRDEEVYLYDSSGTGTLVCASCDPTGGQPIGVHEGNTYEEKLVDWAENWTGGWFAANIPGWDSMDLSNAVYQTRYLSDDGRLYFNSSDALVPADVDGTEDVYEYEPSGVGSCQAPSYGQSGSVVYSEAVGGCVALISPGTSAEESAFMGASASGGDVFFETAAKLSPRDLDAAFDIYDAHECSEASPCAPVQATAPPPCTSTDACREAPQQQPTVFGAPSSATFSGTGDLTSPQPKQKTKPNQKKQNGKQRLKRALKRCNAKRRHSSRRCNRRARRRLRQAHGSARRRGHGHKHHRRNAHSSGRHRENGSRRRGR